MQAAFLLNTYQPLPPPLKHIHSGVERWVEERDRDGGKVPPWVRGLVRRISERRDGAERPREGDANRGEATVASNQGWQSRPAGWGSIWRWRRGERREQKMKRIVIIGDSLVVGIGCKEAPVMPEAICGRLAELLRVDVQWRALGVDGGDVRTIHSKVLAAVDDAVHSSTPPPQPHTRGSAAHRDADQGGKVDAVIVLCGLNDLKRLWMGRTSSVFRRDLDKFLVELRAKVGDECLIVLPAIPMEETLLPEPVRTLGIYMGHLFDEQKREKAAIEALTHFIPKPAMEIWARAKAKGIIVAEDGVHPNERGYDVFGEYLADHLADIMQSPQQLAVQASTLAFEIDLPKQ